MLQIAPDTPLFEVVGARVPALRRLEKMGIKTVHDLLWHFPTRYEDFTKVYAIAELEPGQQATIQGIVEEVQTKRSWRRAMSIVEATIADESGTIRAVWFNQPYVANVLKTGRAANFAGKASVSEEGEIYFSNPVYEVIHVRDTATQEMNHTARLVPVYPETRGLTSRGIRFVTQSLFRKKPILKEWIPREVLVEFHFPELNDAIRSIHFPRQIEDATAARARFSFEELFLLQILNMQQKMKLAQESAPVIKADIERVKAMLAKLPFELTHSQKQSLWEIIKDIEKARPMNRLLQGDVGSGKTVVAAIAAVVASENGLQTAFMAPTEILARQHFETMKKFFAALALDKQPVIGLITGSSAHIFYGNELESKITKPEFYKKVAAGEVSIIFGTHALIQKAMEFAALGLVIIDEQHRFGVRQRAELNGTKNGAPIPHFLSMSATPIPRTLMLSVFGDLDLSLITELPVGRKAIETKIISPIERTATYNFIRAQIKEGRQAFVICPRIDAEEEEPGIAKKLELKSVKEEYEKLSQKIFPDLRIAMLHGQMKPKEKEDVMKKFKDKEFDILVATSVVEVGVDVPNASIMMIEGADRFGLAQLYQFRGRVGRGEYQSYCFLMADSQTGAANARLKAILEAKNGFELAEKDLALRGPGQFFGNVQTGLPDIAMEALRDPELVKNSREAAIKAVTADPQFKKNVALRKKVEEFRARVHQE
ncbi:MAG TPA: ATP-dependent DNA helicase RecG [Candidatus Paceibacterota bacterium]|nr:ATP-dependent DNA helicase RecG [Candidatus Paceibacterota bacterium]